MAYLIYSWHHQIFIKKGHRRGNDCFIPCTEDGGKQHTKCPIHNMELRHDKIICNSVSEIPTALRILTDYMGYSTKLAKSVFDGWASRIRKWTKEEVESMPKTEPKKNKKPVKLLNYVGELVFIPKDREDSKLVQALIDCGYYLERTESTRRISNSSIPYYYTKEPYVPTESIRVNYGIFELSEKEV